MKLRSWGSPPSKRGIRSNTARKTSLVMSSGSREPRPARNAITGAEYSSQIAVQAQGAPTRAAARTLSKLSSRGAIP